MNRRELLLLLGGAMTAGRALRAQRATPVIGFLGVNSPGAMASYVAAFHRGLSETGYVEGQNVTVEYRWAEGRYDGLSALAVDLVGRKVDLLIALLLNPNNPNAARDIKNMQEAAHAKGVQLYILKAGAEGELEPAIDSLVQQHAGALIVGADPFFNSRREELVALAARHALPAIYEWRESVVAGGLISYGPSLTGIYRLLGTYAGKILSRQSRNQTG